MKSLVVEANIVFQALIKRGFMLDLIKLLSSKGYRLYSPEFLSEEIGKRKDMLLQLSGLSKPELEFFINLLLRYINEVPKPEYSSFLSETLKIFPEHIKDAPYFALSFSKEIPLWSDEKRHKLQSKVKVLSTADVKSLFGLP